LRAHQGGALEANQLEKLVSWAPQTSLRVASANMRAFGALVRIEATADSRAKTELTLSGRALLPVIAALERWLLLSPRGAIELDGAAARGAVRILTSTWDSTLIREMAEQPRTLAQLNTQLDDSSYPVLKRSLAKLRSMNLVDPVGARTKGRSFEVSAWLRHAIGPLIFASRWEQLHIATETEPMSRIDVETMFMLAVPLADLPVDTFGTCSLAAARPMIVGEPAQAPDGVSLGFEAGLIAFCAAGPDAKATTWGLGSASAWQNAFIDGENAELLVRGIRPLLIRSIVSGINEAIF